MRVYVQERERLMVEFAAMRRGDILMVLVRAGLPPDRRRRLLSLLAAAAGEGVMV